MSSKKKGHFDSLWKSLLGQIVVVSLSNIPSFLVSAADLPNGYKTVTGDVNFERGNNNLNVNSRSSHAIVEYEAFNVGVDATVNFNLPNSRSAILNRVTGPNASEIYGQINSNGKVFLINPNGVIFGPGSTVNVASLFASTLNITDKNFLDEKFQFYQAGDPAMILNKGVIKVQEGGSVALLGGAIRNEGSIEASSGSINLVAGKSVTVHVDNNLVTSVEVNESLQQAIKDVRAAVENLGYLSAQAKLVRLQAELTSKLYELSVNNEGIIIADGLKSSGGSVELISKSSDNTSVTRNTGTISSQSHDGLGGKVSILGDRVILENEASVDAFGSLGGGEIRIGGDYQGGNPNYNNAQSTFVGSNVQIKADALSLGDGGKVIVWADDSTHFYGSLSAKGGSEGGNGGFAEISGKNSLIAKGEVDLSAPKGEFGTLLYDPLNIQIVGGSADGSDQGNAVSTQLQSNPGSNTLGTISYTDEGLGTPDPFIIYESEIEGTNANIVLQARNGISVSGTFGGSEVLLQNNRNLTMQTRNLVGDGISGIDLTGSTHGNSLLFRTQGTGIITLQTNTGGASTAPIITGGLQSANAAISLQSNGGNINLNGITNSGSGGLTLNSNGGTITQGSGAITAGSLTVSSVAGNATLTNTANNITTLLASSTDGNIFYREADGQSFALGASILSGGGDLTLQVGGAGNITQTGAAVADVLNVTTGSGNATLTNTGNNINSLLASSASGTVSYTEVSNNSFILDSSNLGSGNLTLTTSGTGSITQSGAAVGNIFTVNTGTGSASLNTFNNDFNTFAGTSTSTGTIAFR
ncbi:MAG: filamentous hemagglutinin N-terminal domain-containing protein, partial [Candidatus Caenarcaniphilales bacterium]|nr:filamentous hemagglutinin N-terminal domain-containing protein [Candidatus Caenarcaniphilales bacterium]